MKFLTIKTSAWIDKYMNGSAKDDNLPIAASYMEGCWHKTIYITESGHRAMWMELRYPSTETDGTVLQQTTNNRELESDIALLNKYGIAKLKQFGYYGVIKRLADAGVIPTD